MIRGASAFLTGSADALVLIVFILKELRTPSCTHASVVYVSSQFSEKSKQIVLKFKQIIFFLICHDLLWICFDFWPFAATLLSDVNGNKRSSIADVSICSLALVFSQKK